jgi:hypothetical protein
MQTTQSKFERLDSLKPTQFKRFSQLASDRILNENVIGV